MAFEKRVVEVGQLALPEEGSYKRGFPWRAPLVVAKAVAPLIRSRVVCDVGCGEGDIMSQMALYARRVIGFERNPKRYKLAQRRGLEVVVGDWDEVEIPDADVYYFWGPTPSSNIVIAELIQKKSFPATMIIGGRPGAWQILEAMQRWDGYVLEFPYMEKSEVKSFPPEGLWWLGVVIT